MKSVTRVKGGPVTKRSGGLSAVDEDYRDFGISGELAARVLESGLTTKFSRVCIEGTIPNCRELEDATLPNTNRITEAALKLLEI